MFPRVKSMKSLVPHNGHGIIAHVEKLDEMRTSGINTGLPHPIQMTPPHPARMRRGKEF
jgi:hypothetical protein